MLTATEMRIWTLACGILLSGCRGRPEPAFVQLGEARRLVAQLRVDLSKASDASDRAVLADTDEQSIEFARQARAATDAVAAALPEVAARLSGPDAERLDQFRQGLDQYRKVDAEILALAVENTNLKAQRLSFGPIRQAANDFVAALDGVAQAFAPAKRCRIQDLAARAELAVKEIQILQAPHIAEPTEAEMDRLEKDMASHRAAARAALDGLATAGGTALGARVDSARAALARFDELSQQVIALSRRNTNVRSLRLALQQKPPLTAACDASLASLEGALSKEGLGGTR